MKLSRIMEGMTLQGRQRLSRAVAALLSEGGGSGATPVQDADAAAPLPNNESPIGSTLKRGDKTIFEKTQEGWKTTMRISEDQILGLVRPEVAEQIKNDMRAARGQGEELHIMKMSLKDPGIANKANELLLQRDGEDFADPVPASITAIESAHTSLGLEYASAAQVPLQMGGDAYAIGDAIIALVNGSEPGAKITVPSDQELNGFDDLFGTSNTGKIRAAIQRSGSKNRTTVSIPLSYALDGSIMKFMSDSILRGLGIGKIKFELLGNSYEAPVKLSEEQKTALKAELDKMKAGRKTKS